MTVESRALFNNVYSNVLMTIAKREWKRDFEEWKKCLVVRSSDKATETATWMTGFGYAVEKPEGTPTASDSRMQGPTKTWYHTPYGLKYTITEEAIADDQKGVMRKGTKQLMQSMKATRSLLAMRPFTTAFVTTYHTTADGKALCASDHALIGGGTYSNTMSAAEPTNASIEAAVYNYEYGITDDRGLRYTQKAKSILCGPSIQYDLKRVLESTYDIENSRTDMAKNIAGGMGLNVIVSNEITDDRWFILGEKDPDVGTVFFSRVNPRLSQDQCKDTGNHSYYAYMRFSVESCDARHIYGVPAYS